MIAGYLCGLTAKGTAPSAVAELVGFVAEMDRASAAVDEERYFVLSLDFHDRIAMAAGSERARSTPRPARRCG